MSQTEPDNATRILVETERDSPERARREARLAGRRDWLHLLPFRLKADAPRR